MQCQERVFLNTVMKVLDWATFSSLDVMEEGLKYGGFLAGGLVACGALLGLGYAVGNYIKKASARPSTITIFSAAIGNISHITSFVEPLIGKEVDDIKASTFSEGQRFSLVFGNYGGRGMPTAESDAMTHLKYENKSSRRIVAFVHEASNGAKLDVEMLADRLTAYHEFFTQGHGFRPTLVLVHCGCEASQLPHDEELQRLLHQFQVREVTYSRTPESKKQVLHDMAAYVNAEFPGASWLQQASEEAFIDLRWVLSGGTKPVKRNQTKTFDGLGNPLMWTDEEYMRNNEIVEEPKKNHETDE